MTREEIEMRKVISQMLADVGINRETLKQMVKDVLDEKIENAIAQALQETDFEGKSMSRVNRLVDRELTHLIDTNLNQVVKEEVRKQVNSWDFKVLVEHKRESGGTHHYGG